MAAGMKQSSGVGVALVALLVVSAVATRAEAFTICNIDSSALGTCKSYCKAGSRESSPSQGCCSAVRGANVKCLCRYKGLMGTLGLDPNRAMQIPSKCGFGGPANPCG